MTTEQKALYKNSKCENYQQVNTCMQCSQGFYFSKENDQCLTCQTDNSCAYCDFKDPTRCIMCKSNYFMTVQPNNRCVLNSELDVAEEVQEEVIPDIYIVSDFAPAVASALLSLLVLLFL